MKVLLATLLAGVSLLADTEVIAMHNRTPPAGLPPMPYQENILVIASSTDQAVQFAFEVRYEEAGQPKVLLKSIPAACYGGRCNGAIAVQGSGLRFVSASAKALVVASEGEAKEAR